MIKRGDVVYDRAGCERGTATGRTTPITDDQDTRYQFELVWPDGQRTRVLSDDLITRETDKMLQLTPSHLLAANNR